MPPTNEYGYINIFLPLNISNKYMPKPKTPHPQIYYYFYIKKHL